MKKRLFSLCSLLLLICFICSAFAGCGDKKDKDEDLSDSPLIGYYIGVYTNQTRIDTKHIAIEYVPVADYLKMTFYSIHETDGNYGYTIEYSVGISNIKKVPYEIDNSLSNITFSVKAPEDELEVPDYLNKTWTYTPQRRLRYFSSDTVAHYEYYQSDVYNSITDFINAQA